MCFDGPLSRACPPPPPHPAAEHQRRTVLIATHRARRRIQAATPEIKAYGCGWRSWDRSSSDMTEIPLRFHIFAAPLSPPAPVRTHSRCMHAVPQI
eukprot:COSAG01_NODE_4451_length_5007_cov_5.064181_5_plen_96_part_00